MFSGTESGASTDGSREEVEGSEIIFLGTGTSEGIPRVSCLTNPSKTCPVILISFFLFFF
jgi:hypothetical protein